MHHYEGQLTLRRTSDGGRALALRSGIRPQVHIDAGRFDVQVDLLSGDELCPGEDAQVAVSFLSPELVHSRIRAGATYPVFEGEHEIGSLVVRADVWKDPERVVQVGSEYDAVVTKVGWTAAEVTLENGWRATLHSRDVGLPPWAEIGGSCMKVSACASAWKQSTRLRAA